jgi:hypothetical protein
MCAISIQAALIVQELVATLMDRSKRDATQAARTARNSPVEAEAAHPRMANGGAGGKRRRMRTCISQQFS